MEEIVINIADKIYMWSDEKPGNSLDSFVGRLILTSDRLLFLSAGTSGVAKHMTMSLLFGPIAGLILGQTKTEDLDLSALQNKGSLTIDLKDIRSFEIKRTPGLLTYVCVTKETFIGERTYFSFASRFALTRRWLDKFREDLLSAKQKNL